MQNYSSGFPFSVSINNPYECYASWIPHAYMSYDGYDFYYKDSDYKRPFTLEEFNNKLQTDPRFSSRWLDPMVDGLKWRDENPL